MPHLFLTFTQNSRFSWGFFSVHDEMVMNGCWFMIVTRAWLKMMLCWNHKHSTNKLSPAGGRNQTPYLLIHLQHLRFLQISSSTKILHRFLNIYLNAFVTSSSWVLLAVCICECVLIRFATASIRLLCWKGHLDQSFELTLFVSL